MPEYVQRETWTDETIAKADRLLDELRSSKKLHPWTLISRTVREGEDREDLRRNALKPLVLQGYIMPDADGYLFIDKRHNFEKEVKQS